MTWWLIGAELVYSDCANVTWQAPKLNVQHTPQMIADSWLIHAISFKTLKLLIRLTIQLDCLFYYVLFDVRYVCACSIVILTMWKLHEQHLAVPRYVRLLFSCHFLLLICYFWASLLKPLTQFYEIHTYTLYFLKFVLKCLHVFSDKDWYHRIYNNNVPNPLCDSYPHIQPCTASIFSSWEMPTN